MHRETFLKEYRTGYIKSLQYWLFLDRLLKVARNEYGKNPNPLIVDFIKTLESLSSWEWKKVAPYCQFCFLEIAGILSSKHGKICSW